MSKKKITSNLSNINYIDTIMDREVDLKNRIIYLWDRTDLEDTSNHAIDGRISLEFIKNLQLLLEESEEPIILRINTCGGNTSDGYAIYDAIKCCPAKIIGIVIGQCMSAGTIALAACDVKISYPKSVFMVHDGTPGSMGHSLRDSESWVKYNKLERFQYYKLMAESTNKSSKFWQKMCNNDKVFNANKAIKYGLIDKIIPYSKKK